MRKLQIRSYGDTTGLEVVDAAVPVAGPGEVLVRVRAAPLQIADVALREGLLADHMPDPSLPMSMGWEFAGTVETVGPETDTDLKRGDSVIGMSRHFFTNVGTYADYVAVPTSGVAAAPRSVDHVTASTLPIALTAVQALDMLNVESQTTVLVTGAAGTVGGYALQLARMRGATVIASVDPTDSDAARELGADHVINRYDDLADQVHSILGSGVDACLDAASDPNALNTIADGGSMVAVVLPIPDTDRNIEVQVVFVEPNAQQLAALVEVVDQGRITLRVADTYDLTEAATAHQRLEEGGLRGRLVFDMNQQL